MIKTTCWRGINAPRVPFASRENVSPIGSRRQVFDGALSPLSFSQFFHTNHWVSRQLRQQVGIVVSCFYLSCWIFSPVSKTVKMCDGPYKSRKSNHKNIHGYWRLIFLLKRFGEALTGDPNAPVDGLGPPIPPSTRVKNLRVVWKRPYRRFLGLIQISQQQRSFPLQKPTRAHLF